MTMSYGAPKKVGTLEVKPETLVKNGTFKPSRIFETFVKTLQGKGLPVDPRRGPGTVEFHTLEYMRKPGDPSWWAFFKASGDTKVEVWTHNTDPSVQKRLSEKLKEVAAELNSTDEKLEYGMAAMKAKAPELPQDVERYMLGFIGKDLKNVPGAPIKALALKTQKQKKGRGRRYSRTLRRRLL